MPWKVAGRLTEQAGTPDEVVQRAGWAFKKAPGDSFADFVATGDEDVRIYLDLFDIERPDDNQRTLVQIGAGIGRMTCGFTRRYGRVFACDLDAGFLERCREAVAQYGYVGRLRTIQVLDGRTLDIGDDAADVTFSYITLQHCDRADAFALVDEAVRVTKAGGRIALNFRTWTSADTLLVPLGSLVRGLFRVPGLGARLSEHKVASRLSWQANRLDPYQVLGAAADRLTAVEVWRHPDRSTTLAGLGDVTARQFEGINPSHWWLVADIA